MKIIVVDDEMAALNTFLPNVVDSLNIECKMFMNSPRAALEYVRINKVDAAFFGYQNARNRRCRACRAYARYKADTENRVYQCLRAR